MRGPFLIFEFSISTFPHSLAAKRVPDSQLVLNQKIRIGDDGFKCSQMIQSCLVLFCICLVREKVGHFYILKNTFFLNKKRSIAASRANTTRDPRILAATNGKLMNPKRPPVMVRIYSVNHLSPTISKNRYINIEFMPNQVKKTSQRRCILISIHQ